MAWFRNYYRCEECRHQWENQSSAMCDGDCSQCGAWHMRPYDSDDLTEIIEEREGQFLVYRSPASAGHYPNYERVAKFPTLTQAKMYCDCARRNDNQSGRLRSKSELGRLKSRAIEDGLLSISGDADFDIQQHRFNNLGQFITFLNPFSGFSGFLGRSRTIQSITNGIFCFVANASKNPRNLRNPVPR
jgi:hypothetical protein